MKKIDSKLKKALIKKAFGYTQEETIEEYVKQEDEVVLSKKKVTKKDVAPDLTAIKLMMDYFDLNDKKIDEMTTEELLKEKEKLKEILENYNKVEDDGNM